MARPTKQGLDYFPLDVNLDSKFKFIEIKFGLKGFAIVIKIFQKIYSSCYWYKFDEDEILLFAHEINVDINEVNAIINESIERDIFDKNLYETHQILTSKGIQKRYQEIVKRRKDVEVIEEYLLIDGDFGINDNINEDNDNINPSTSVVNDSKSTQSKVNKSKVNNIVYAADERLNKAIIEFIAFRKKIKSPMTERAIEIMIKKLETLTAKSINPLEDKIEILNQSILNGWKGVFPLSNQNKSNFGNKKDAPVPNWYEDYEKQLESLPKREKMSQDEIDRILREAEEKL